MATSTTTTQDHPLTLTSRTRPTGGPEGSGTTRLQEVLAPLQQHPPPPPNLSSEQELGPRVEPRPPATKENSLNMDLEDDALLDGIHDEFMYQTHQSRKPSQGSPPLLSSPTSIQATPMDTGACGEPTVGDKLLSLRKELKKTAVSLLKVQAHLDFASACQTQQRTPKGLKINVKCSALLENLTNVKQKFDTTTKAAEADYVSHLKTHNEAVVEQLSAKQSIIHNTMETLQSQASMDERKAHHEMMEKTSANLAKLGDNLAKSKKRIISASPTQSLAKAENWEVWAPD